MDATRIYDRKNVCISVLDGGERFKEFNMKSFKILVLPLLAVMLFAGCHGLQESSDSDEKSALVISLSETVSRSILPDIDMNVSSFSIMGSGPDGASFSIVTAEEKVTFRKLAFGDWNIVVKALNAEGAAIGSCSGTATVQTGKTTEISLLVVPYEGFGTLSLTVNWTAEDIENAAVAATLTGKDGEPVELEFALSDGKAVFGSTCIAAGYYTLALRLLDSGLNTMGSVEVVRIVKDAVTAGIFNYYEINAPGGTIDVNIDQQMDDPIDVVIEGAALSMAVIGSMAVTASAPDESENLQYVWYLNGEFFGLGETVAVSALEAGVYNLNALAYTVDGGRWGSSGVTFHVTELDYSAYTMIHDIQGAGHVSAYVGQSVSNVVGIVTARDSKQFWLQSPLYDSDDSTSEGILVYVGSVPSVTVGDLVLVKGTVKEYGYTDELKMTELVSPVIQETIQTGCTLPDAVILGNGGRTVPKNAICNDSVSTVYDSTFDPSEDAIDFYESLESMLVQVNDALAVAGDKYGEIPVLSDGGVDAAEGLNLRGGVTISADNFNPNLLFIDSDASILGLGELEADAGDRFSESVVGVMSYSYGKFLVLPTILPDLVKGSLAKETTELAGTDSGLTVATFNVENYPRDDDAMTSEALAAKIEDIALSIVEGLNCPDILAVEEIMDDSYSADDGVVSADANFALLIDAIEAAGGLSTYDYRQINPVNDAEGGWIGANIRVGFLFNTARVSFEDIGSGDSATDTLVLDNNGKADISLSPGRISAAAFSGSRVPLIGKFLFGGEPVFVIANHFNSKGGDTALFGEAQPPVLGSEAERLVQAAAINAFVDEMLAVQSDANIVVAGDLNDFQFSPPLETLKGGVLYNLTEELLPESEQYSYSYNGNSQQLDHLLVSSSLLGSMTRVDIVHRNSEFSAQTRHTDHDPIVALLYPGSGSGGSNDGGEALYFSDYGEGSSYNKYLEVYNGGSSSVVLQDAAGVSNYLMMLVSNGAALTSGAVRTFPNGMTIEAGGIVGIYNSSAAAAITSKMGTDVSFSSTVTNFNGNDAVVLVEDVNHNSVFDDGIDSVVDMIGTPGDAAYFGDNRGLTRNSTVKSGSSVFDASEWTAYSLAEVDAGTYYGVR